MARRMYTGGVRLEIVRLEIVRLEEAPDEEGA